MHPAFSVCSWQACPVLQWRHNCHNRSEHRGLSKLWHSTGSTAAWGANVTCEWNFLEVFPKDVCSAVCRCVSLTYATSAVMLGPLDHAHVAAAAPPLRSPPRATPAHPTPPSPSRYVPSPSDVRTPVDSSCTRTRHSHPHATARSLHCLNTNAVACASAVAAR